MSAHPLSAPASPTRRPLAPADYDHVTVGRVGRLAMTGALVGSLVLGTVVAVVAAVASGSAGYAMGLGGAVALTGGPFFGSLVGFAMAVHAAEVSAAEALLPVPVAPAAPPTA